MKILETERMILRPWRLEDAEALYEYARDPDVGPRAGWVPHTSVEDSREILRTVFIDEGTLAVTLKERGDGPIGSIGVFTARSGEAKGDPELGYWLAKPFWGRGLIPEAVERFQRYVFEETDARHLWCAYFEGNEQSKRVAEKCGFTYRYSQEKGPWPTGEASHLTHYCRITREEWQCRSS